MEKGGNQPNTTGHMHVLHKKVDSLLLHFSLKSLVQKFKTQLWKPRPSLHFLK